MLNIFGDFWSGSSTIAPEENCPPTAKLILIKPLNLTRGQFSSKAIVCLPPTLKLNLTLTQTPTLPGGQFSREEIFWIPYGVVISSFTTSTANFTKFDVRNASLFIIKALGRKVKETILARYLFH